MTKRKGVYDVLGTVIDVAKSCRYPKFSEFFYKLSYSRQYPIFAKQVPQTNMNRGVLDRKTEYLKYWRSLSNHIETTSFKYFSNYVDNVEKIIPESIGRSIIEPILNPLRFRPYYSDKNMFGKICGIENVPKTIAYRINGGPIMLNELMEGDISHCLPGSSRGVYS